MERYDEKTYILAKRIIRNAINKIIKDKFIIIGKSKFEIDTTDMNDIRNGVEMLIRFPLTHEVADLPYDVSPEIIRELELTLSIFDEVYDVIYEEFLAKEAIEFKEEIKLQKCGGGKGTTIQEKADIFNAKVREIRKNIQPENYSKTKSNAPKEKENLTIQGEAKILKYIPISKGKMGKEQEVDWDR